METKTQLNRRYVPDIIAAIVRKASATASHVRCHARHAPTLVASTASEARAEGRDQRPQKKRRGDVVFDEK